MTQYTFITFSYMCDINNDADELLFYDRISDEIYNMHLKTDWKVDFSLTNIDPNGEFTVKLNWRELKCFKDNCSNKDLEYFKTEALN